MMQRSDSWVEYLILTARFSLSCIIDKRRKTYSNFVNIMISKKTIRVHVRIRG